MSKAPILVPIFPYAAEGVARPRFYFRQENWGRALKAWQGSDPAACNMILIVNPARHRMLSA